MRELENYYHSIANLLNKSLPVHWSKAFVLAPVLGSCVGGIRYGASDHTGATLDFDINWGDISDLKELFIRTRDSLLRNTGERIWSIRFEMTSDGKFSAKFDYEPPSWYDEEDDPLMSWEQIANRQFEEIKIPRS